MRLRLKMEMGTASLPKKKILLHIFEVRMTRSCG